MLLSTVTDEGAALVSLSSWVCGVCTVTPSPRATTAFSALLRKLSYTILTPSCPPISCEEANSLNSAMVSSVCWAMSTTASEEAFRRRTAAPAELIASSTPVVEE